MSPALPSTPPAPAELLAYHDQMVTALRALGRLFDEEVKRPGSPFYGFRPREFNASLERLRDELDQQVVLVLAASAEALVRGDYAARLDEPRGGEVHGRFRILEAQYGERVSLEDILDVWKDACDAGEEVGQLKQLYHRRHWLAHGRYWADKSGVQPDPRSAFRIIEDFVGCLRAHAPDFPRRH